MKFNLKFLLLTLFISAISMAQTKGTISGVLSDKEMNNTPLPFANVLIKGTNISANTDIDGKYTLSVNPGNYTVIFSFLGYETVETPVIVKSKEIVTINRTLSSGGYALKDVVVKSTSNREKETALLLDQKNAVVIKQSIGAQEMSRKGVSDVEEGLTKITGITKVGSRGLFVRGLEDRYNNLMINDLAAPTNNPFLKIIPLDLFSTDIVGVIEVYKTFSPNIYGDFAGGTFNIQTSKNTKSITKINIGTSYTVNSNFKRFSLSKDADSAEGFFGMTGDNRKLPSLLGDTPASHVFTPEESLNNFQSGFDVSSIRTPLNTSIGFLHSEKFDLNKDRNFSYILSINAENSYAIQEGVDRTFAYQSTGINYKTDFITTDNHYKTSLTGLLGLNYNTKRFKLSYNSLFIRTTDNLIKDQYGVGLFQIPFYDKIGYGHTGGIDGFSSVFSHFDDENIDFALTSNGTHFNNNNIAIALLSAVYNKPYDIPNFSSHEVSSEDLDKYLGIYASKQIPLKITITKDKKTLVAQATGQSAFPLEATEKDKFKFEQAGIVLEFRPEEKTMKLKQGGGEFLFNLE